MYKIVIVDDEPIIVKGLSKTIPWKKWGCVVVGTAEDGREGLRVIAQNRPDMVITDISMPGMDGLEMIAALRSEYPEMEVSILSGFRDFDYARKAIGLGVTRFLLKPSKLDEIKEAILSMVVNIDEKRHQRHLIESYYNIINEKDYGASYDKTAAPVIGDMAAAANAANAAGATAAGTTITVPGTATASGVTTASSGVTTTASGITTTASGITTTASGITTTASGITTTASGITTTVSGITTTASGITTIASGIAAAAPVITATAPTAATTADVIVITTGAAGTVTNTGIDAGTDTTGTDTVTDMADITTTASGITPVASGITVTGSDTTASDPAAASAGPAVTESGTTAAAIGIMSTAAAAAAPAGDAMTERPSEPVMKVQAGSATTDRSDNQAALPLSADKTVAGKNAADSNDEKSATVTPSQDVGADFPPVAEEMIAGSFVVNNAIKFIEENYRNKIKLNDVAEQVYVSQWHLSKLLNRHAGQSFSELLNQVRIEKAKELLKDPSLRIGDIADMVGFLDMAHFSRVFKKMTGISAHVYRNGKIN